MSGRRPPHPRTRPASNSSMNRLQRIRAASKANFLRMLQCFPPAHVRIAVHEMISIIVEVRIRKMISQLGIPNRLCLQTQIHTGLVQCNRIKGRQHADIRKNRRIVFSVTIAVRRNIRDQRNMEARPSVTNCLRILRNLAAEDLVGIPIIVGNRIEGTGTDATRSGGIRGTDPHSHEAFRNCAAASCLRGSRTPCQCSLACRQSLSTHAP